MIDISLTADLAQLIEGLPCLALHQIKFIIMTAQQKVIHWADGLQVQRLPILAAMLTIHGCVTVPLTMVLMNFAGVTIASLSIVVLATFAILVTNLAALPTKITVPTYLIATAIHLAVIFISIFQILM